MKPTLQSFLSLGILLVSLTLVSMAPNKPIGQNDKRHIIHKGVRLCLGDAAFQAHHRKHIGIMDCELVSWCSEEATTFHKH
jgi:hypothetical protein